MSVGGLENINLPARRRSVPFDALVAGCAQHGRGLRADEGAAAGEPSQNREATHGEITTAAGKEAAGIGLGDMGAATLADAVSREKIFNLLPKALGGTTTARQLDEFGNPALDVLSGALSAGGHYGLGSVAALGAGLARGIASAAKKSAVRKGQREAAPSVADALVGRGVLPSGAHLDKTLLEMLAAVRNPSVVARTVPGAGFGGMEAQRDSLAGSFR